MANRYERGVIAYMCPSRWHAGVCCITCTSHVQPVTCYTMGLGAAALGGSRYDR